MNVPDLTGITPAMPLPDVSGVPSVIAMNRSTTKESSETAANIDWSDEDNSIETGEQPHDSQMVQGQRARWKAFVRKIRLQLLIAMAVFLVLIIVLAYGLSASNKSTTGTSNADTQWYTNEPGDASIPSSNLPSIDDQLAEVLDMSLLQDNRTPLGRAYMWISQQDEISSVDNFPRVIQRFALAAFYFATGGGRTSATWDMCSAVPTGQALENKSGSTVCVTEDGNTNNNKAVVCANAEAFVDCDEYYDPSDLFPPPYPKRRWLSEVSECDWYGISCDGNGILEDIVLPQNNLVGTLLSELDLLTNLKTLNLAGNALTGVLPDWSQWKHVEHIILSGMGLEGSIPSSWQANWKDLATLDLGDNQLSGTVALPGNWMQLDTVILSHNSMDVEFQPEIVEVSGLSELNLTGNSIGSTFPDAVSQVKSLLVLDLSECNLSGSIPESLWQLTNLKELRIGGNSLSGSLSQNVGNLRELVSLSVAGLTLTSLIPPTLGNLVALKELELQQNAFTGLVPDEICEIPSLISFKADCASKDGLICACCTVCCQPGKPDC